MCFWVCISVSKWATLGGWVRQVRQEKDYKKLNQVCVCVRECVNYFILKVAFSSSILQITGIFKHPLSSFFTDTLTHCTPRKSIFTKSILSTNPEPFNFLKKAAERHTSNYAFNGSRTCMSLLPTIHDRLELESHSRRTNITEKQRTEREDFQWKTLVDNTEQGQNNNLWGNSQNNFTASIYYINAFGYIRIWIIICTTFDSLSLTQARHSGEKSRRARQVWAERVEGGDNGGKLLSTAVPTIRNMRLRDESR